jgi:dephospho-CoA kinase
LSAETPKQRLRRLLDRLKIDDAKKRELDQAIEEASAEEAEMMIEWMEDLERETPGTIDEAIREINTNGFPDDDSG